MMHLEKVSPEKTKSYKISSPFLAKVVEKRPLNETTSKEEVFHIVLDFSGSELRFYEGQAVGIIPPGAQPDGRPLKPRLYSIASNRSGEKGNPNLVALTVKRSVYIDPNTQQEGYGVCSDYLCNIRVGDQVACISPTGRLMLLPLDLNQDFVFIATGTGVAPIKSYLDYLLDPKQAFNGRILLYLGYRSKQDALYCNFLDDSIAKIATAQQLHWKLALSREMQTETGKRLYVSDLILQDRAVWQDWAKSDKLAFYICGLQGMEQGIEQSLATVLGPSFAEQKKLLLENKRWNLEVY